MKSNPLPVVLIHPDGRIGRPSLYGDYLQDLRLLVGGSLETVPLSGSSYLVMNELAKSENHERNVLATAIARQDEVIARDDFIAGVAVIVPQSLLSCVVKS